MRIDRLKTKAIMPSNFDSGTMPISAVVANNEVMMTIKPGQHGSTYGGNPLACVVAMESLKARDVFKIEYMCYIVYISSFNNEFVFRISGAY